MHFSFLDPSDPFEKKCSPYTYLFWMIAGAGCAAILTVIFNFLSLLDDPSFKEAAEGLFSVSPHLSVMVLLYCVISPTIEEIIFRYLVFGFINKKTGKTPLSILATAMLFGIYHLNPVQMLYGFLMGLLITCGYSRHRNIFIPILTHSAANMVALIFTFAPFRA